LRLRHSIASHAPFILDDSETKALGFGTHKHAKIFRRANPLALAEGAEDLGVDVFLRRAFSDLGRARGRSLSGFIVAKIFRSYP
jgi:hypothetical protein